MANPNSRESTETGQHVTVVVVAISSRERLEDCLVALSRQRSAPPFDVVVAHDRRDAAIQPLSQSHPSVSFLPDDGDASPPELATRAIKASTGDVVLLTEDHCVPNEHWVATLCAEQRADRAAVGGPVRPDDRCTATDLAVYFVDFFRYMPPRESGISPSLTHCNISYRRSQLDEIAALWQTTFDETTINAALQSRFGALWIASPAFVTMRRHVRLHDAMRERYSFGRLFGALRSNSISLPKRTIYAIVAPVLPLIVLGRIAAVAVARGAGIQFLRALPPLIALVIAWTWGEWLGNLTRRKAQLFVASEI